MNQKSYIIDYSIANQISHIALFSSAILTVPVEEYSCSPDLSVH